MLEAKNLEKFYREKHVVKKVSLQVKPGQIVGLLGSNGAGKTTTFYMVMGLITPNQGQVFLNATDITKKPIHKRARMGIGYIPQETSIFEKLSVEDNIIGVLQFYMSSKKKIAQRCTELLEELGLENLRKSLAISLSGGEKKRLEIARAMVNNPQIILMDEPFAGVDPIAIEAVHKLMYSLVKKNIGILITDHNAKEILRIVDKVFLMNNGEILTEGTPETIVKHSLAKKYYFGSHFSSDEQREV